MNQFEYLFSYVNFLRKIMINKLLMIHLLLNLIYIHIQYIFYILYNLEYIEYLLLHDEVKIIVKKFIIQFNYIFFLNLIYRLYFYKVHILENQDFNVMLNLLNLNI